MLDFFSHLSTIVKKTPTKDMLYLKFRAHLLTPPGFPYRITSIPEIIHFHFRVRAMEFLDKILPKIDFFSSSSI